ETRPATRLRRAACARPRPADRSARPSGAESDGASRRTDLQVRDRVHPMHGRPAGLVLDLRDSRRRGVERPEPVEPETERTQHDHARHDAAAHVALASARATAAHWPRPAAVSGMSREPANRRSRTHSVSPCRTTKSLSLATTPPFYPDSPNRHVPPGDGLAATSAARSPKSC